MQYRESAPRREPGGSGVGVVGSRGIGSTTAIQLSTARMAVPRRARRRGKEKSKPLPSKSEDVPPATSYSGRSLGSRYENARGKT